MSPALVSLTMSIAICKANSNYLLRKMSYVHTGRAGATPSPIPVACMKTESYNLNVSAIGYRTFCYGDMMTGL